MADNYQDIIKNPHHTSKTRKRMPSANRAAQFAPFAALTGYDASILEAQRLTENRIDLDDKAKEILNMKLNFIKERINQHPHVTVTYFVPDTKKNGGAYMDYSGNIRTIDEYSKTLIMVDRTIISIEMIQDMRGEIFING